MVRWIMIGILTIGLATTTFWGYQEHKDKNAVLIQAENTYQRSFHELSYNMDLLHDKIGSTLAMNTKERLSPQLIEIWQITSDSLSNVGQLPLTLLPFNKTEEFLSSIGDFSYQTAVRDLKKDPLSEDEVETLNNLYAQSEEITNELRKVQHDVLENNLRWMDVQLALATSDEQEDNTIIDGFKTVEKKVEGYADGNQDSSLIGTPQQEDEEEYAHMQGEKVSKEDALKHAQSLIDIKNDNQLTINKSGKGSKIPLYTISYDSNDFKAHIDMSQKGGHPISMLVDRSMGDKSISLHDGLEIAEQYIQDMDFEDMEVYRSSQYDAVGVYSFLYKQDSVKIYPDTIDVKVGLDKEDILGLTTQNYYMNHKKREIPETEITLEEAKSKVNPNVSIQENDLALIDNDLGEEVLTYEFIGTMGANTYRIFINAIDGKEERVEKLESVGLNFAGL